MTLLKAVDPYNSHRTENRTSSLCFNYWLLERLDTTDELPTGTHGQTDWFIAFTVDGATCISQHPPLFVLR